MIGRYGRTARARASSIHRNSPAERFIIYGRRTSVPVKWEIRRETVSSELQNIYFCTPQGNCKICEITLTEKISG